MHANNYLIILSIFLVNLILINIILLLLKYLFFLPNILIFIIVSHAYIHYC
jgi:hypothetical protein